MNPKVSVIVTVYNVEPYIEKCARTLFGQTLNEIEYIFVNDGSTDHSLNILQQVCRDYPERQHLIKIISHGHNKGVACARNTGLKAARGEYIIHADSDDWVAPEMYAVMYALAQEYAADIVGCDFIKEFGEYQVLINQPYVDNPEMCIRKLLTGEIFPSLWCELVKRELYINNGLIFKEKVDIGEDLAINIQLYSYAEKIVHTPFPFYHYRRTNLNSYCNVRGIKSINSEIQVAKIITLFLNEKYGEKAFKDEIIYRQFVSKMALWTDRSCRDYRRWLTVFPETNQRIWKYKKLSWKTRLECWLAIHGFPGLADGFIQFLHFQRKLRDHFL